MAIVAGVSMAWIYKLASRPPVGSRKSGACGTCCALTTSNPPPSLVVSARKGERPILLVKMR